MIGLLNLHKPAGPTSRDVVNRVQRLARPHKTGHAGTLDPIASGVLVVCLGRATRLIEYVQQMPKRYRAEFRFGLRSATDDLEGELEPVAAPLPTVEEIDAALPEFLGTISQRPPAYSAVKVGGKRAYKLARRGAEFELAARPVVIHALRRAGYNPPHLTLEIECGSGTYIRALGRDLAERLGTAAVMTGLARTAIGPFTAEAALPFDELNAETLEQNLLPALAAVPHLPRVTLTAAEALRVAHGLSLPLPPPEQVGGPPRELAACHPEGTLLAILEPRGAAQWGPSRYLGEQPGG